MDGWVGCTSACRLAILDREIKCHNQRTLYIAKVHYNLIMNSQGWRRSDYKPAVHWQTALNRDAM